MLRALFLVVSLFVVLAAGQVQAQSFQDGVAAFQKGDFQTALKIWRPMADAGDPEAQRNIGVMYQQGLGVPQDFSEAAAWYRRAAEQGHARAQQNLGALYEKGEGVPQNYAEAAKWYVRAAQGGNMLAKYNLGILYEQGVPGVPINVVLAHMWFNLAAAQGSADAARFRDELAANMSRDQVAEAQRQAQEWLDKHPE